MSGHRSLDDVDRGARALATHFSADVVYIVGSQALLLSRPDAPESLRWTPEIDAYPGNAREWEEAHPGYEASEEVNALFGEMSRFHETWGFYVDGVDERTARLPEDWRERRVTRTIPAHGRTVEVVAPCIDDLVVSKLCRFREKDRDFVRDLQGLGWVDIEVVRRRMPGIGLDEDLVRSIDSWLAGLASTVSQPSGP